MGVIATAARELIAAGITGDALIEALERIEDAQPRGGDQPTARQERNRRYYEKRRLNASENRLNKTIKTLSDGGDPSPDKEKSPTPPKEINPSPPSLRSGNTLARARETLAELEQVLDHDRAAAVVDHRKRLRKPLTAHAAKLLATKLGRCDDPNTAADAMIANGWQGFEPEWLTSRQHGTGPPRERIVNGFAARALRLAEEDHEPADHQDQQPGTGTAGARPRARDVDEIPGLLDAVRSDETGRSYAIPHKR